MDFIPSLSLVFKENRRKSMSEFSGLNRPYVSIESMKHISHVSPR